MKEAIQNWDDYARLQTLSRSISRIDSFSWGVEAELDHFLESPATYVKPQSRSLNRAHQSAARRERARNAMRETSQRELRTSGVDPVAQIEAREALLNVKSRVARRQWELLLSRAEGNGYAEIARIHQISSSAARCEVSRLRKQLSQFSLAA